MISTEKRDFAFALHGLTNFVDLNGAFTKETPSRKANQFTAPPSSFDPEQIPPSWRAAQPCRTSFTADIRSVHSMCIILGH